jgi:tetrahydromethanopterin S-methyltransferase subunit F
MRRTIARNQLQPQLTEPEAGVTPCRMAGMILGMLLVGIVLSQVPDLIRYFRMSSM